MAAKSAKNGTVSWGGSPTAVTDVTDIQINEVTEALKYGSSSTSGEKRVVPGMSDITGSFKCLQDDIPSGIEDGTTVTLTITSDGSVSMFNDSAYIESITYSLPVGSGGLIEATVTFHRNG